MNTHLNYADSIKALDESEIGKSHWRMIITAGMGFFTDAYDLFVIGVVTTLLVSIWHLSTYQIALLNGVSLAAAAFGALSFGWLSDKLGRKKIYGIEILILVGGALLSAFAASFAVLLVARLIVGFGIGGDYPTSAVVACESANRKNRGFLVLLVFAMQALGLIVGPLLASFLMALQIPNDLVWRLLLGLGAIPAGCVFFLRRKISESPRFLATQKQTIEYSRIIHELAGLKDKVSEAVYVPQKLHSKKWLKCLLGTAGAWFLLDVAFYGNGISSMLIMKAINPGATLLEHTLLAVLIFACFAFPGYFFAAKYVDKMGRKPMQMLGFAIMAVCYFIIAVFPALNNILPLFVLVFGLSFFFVNFGPNATTFLIPSEIYPTNIRAKAHGLSAAFGKVGAFIGAFFLPILLHKMGLPHMMLILTGVCLLGILATLLVPEMKQRSLDFVEIED